MSKNRPPMYRPKSKFKRAARKSKALAERVTEPEEGAIAEKEEFDEEAAFWTEFEGLVQIVSSQSSQSYVSVDTVTSLFDKLEEWISEADQAKWRSLKKEMKKRDGVSNRMLTAILNAGCRLLKAREIDASKAMVAVDGKGLE